MNKTWEHSKLGAFEYDEECGQWIGTCKLPHFKTFAWEAKAKKPNGHYRLHFSSPEGHEPSAAAAKIALRVIANHEKLASLVAPTLWEDFNGRGGDSGMWWHGDLELVAEQFGYDDRPAPKGPKDLIPVMRFAGVTMHESVYRYKQPVAELRFGAVFEEEHGIGLLTDGNKIIGAGYLDDASPFK